MPCSGLPGRIICKITIRFIFFVEADAQGVAHPLFYVVLSAAEGPASLAILHVTSSGSREVC